MLIIIPANFLSSSARKRPIRKLPSPAKLPFSRKFGVLQCFEVGSVFPSFSSSSSSSSSGLQFKEQHKSKDFQKNNFDIKKSTEVVVATQFKGKKRQLAIEEKDEDNLHLAENVDIPLPMSIPSNMTTTKPECWSQKRRVIRDVAWESAVGILNDRCLTDTEARYDTYTIDAR